MNRQTLFASVVAGVGLLAGCATIEPRDAFTGVREPLAARTDARVEWRGITADDAALDHAVDQMLQSPLTADQAVQVALLNNRALQATYEEVGIAQADLVQAGLLRNPVFDLTVRWPDESPRTANIEMAVVWNFLDIFFIPARKRIARQQFEAARLRVAGEVLDTAAEAREAYYTLVGAQQSLETRRAELTAAEAGAEAAQRLRAAGNITELELAEQQAQAARARLELTAAEADVTLERERLAELLGVAGAAGELRVAPHLPEPPDEEVPVSVLESNALERRFELLAARREAAARARSARLTEATRYFDDVEAGVDAEREVEGTWLVGPTVSAPIPLLDQGQASLARARAEFRQAHQRYLAQRNAVRSEVRTAAARLSTARARVEYYRDVLLPLRGRVVEQSQLEYNAMLIGVFELLEARREELKAQREYVEALRDYWIARGELERASGGRLPGVAKPQATAPATTQQHAPPPPADHQHRQQDHPQPHQHHGD